jgi:hypothetical protein
MLDTLALASNLKDAGLTDDQSAAVARAIGDAVRDSAVTKLELEAALNALLVKVVLAMIAVAGVTLAVAKAF